jgi:hypothetical protein
MNHKHNHTRKHSCRQLHQVNKSKAPQQFQRAKQQGVQDYVPFL